MNQVISLGTQSFEKLRQNHSFYIDKTLLIQEWWENQDDVTLIMRPRRFGKTLNLNMLDCFFSNQYAGRGDLFEGLAIWESEKYRQLQGTYPVISVSFATVKGDTYETARDEIVQIIINLYTQYYFLTQGDALSPMEKAYFDYIKMDMSDSVVTMALHRLSICLSHYYGKKVLIFLDEYDTPLQEAYVGGYWDKMVGFIRGMFNAAFKTNPYIERALLTGITRISKESLFSDLNNLTVITTTSEGYNTRFGFTEEEVFHALDFFGVPEEKEQVKAWYDGFTFGSRHDIYNPWSITGFLKEKRYKPYWANTSSNSLISVLIRGGKADIKITLEDLLDGKALIAEIDEEIVFNQLQGEVGAIWSLLLASGYLRVEEQTFDPENGTFFYALKLTNKEVAIMFRNIIRKWFTGDSVPYNDFLKAMLQGDVKAMNQYMNQVIKETFSSFDSGKKPSEEAQPERFYHGFVLGLMAEFKGRYRITSNRESGFGRYDVMLEPMRAEDPAFVLEFKVHDRDDGASLADTVEAARKQIEEKAYDTELTARGVAKERIRHYGFAFEGKKVLIG
ncbi:MAG: ATP-binding protein [Roseburia sp.]|nr:ATP-binding protein [Roseburia sp.]MCM1096699.1 ATP-binding protein [Ruminococcus flavefaciens]